MLSLLAAATTSVLIFGTVAADGGVEPGRLIDTPSLVGTPEILEVVEPAPAPAVTGYDAMISDLEAEGARQVAPD